MEITLHRKLLEATFNCTSTTPCTDPYAYYYYYCCVTAPAPSPVADQSPPSGGPHNHNHAVPYLVSAACLLGVLSLILTTCTILLRHRFSRSPRVASSRDPHAASVNEDHTPVDHPIWHIVTVGLPQSAIDSIASVKYKSSEGLIEESDCSVCLTGFEDGDDLRLLPKCSHAFHLPCIDTWLSSHKSCPLCRSPVVNDSPPANVNLRDSSPNSSSPGPSETALIDNSDSLDDYDNDSSHVEGAEVLKSDPEKRVLSGLGVAREDFEAVRRSISLDSSAAVDNVGIQTGEGSSQQEKMIELEEADKEGHIGESGISRLIKSSSSIGRSSAKILSSLRGSKSQSSSTLPHM